MKQGNDITQRKGRGSRLIQNISCVEKNVLNGNLISLSRISRVDLIRGKKTVPLILQFLEFFCIPEEQELLQLISGFCKSPDIQHRINGTIQKHHTGRNSHQNSHGLIGVINVRNRIQQEVGRAT